MMIAGRVVEPGWPVRIGLLVLPLLALAAFVAVTRPPEPKRNVVATLGGRAFDLVVADTPQLRARGLQGFPEPARAAGMLFVYDRPQEVTVAIKTLPYRIDVAFIDARMRVVRTVSMQPEPFGIQRATSGVPVLYVVEARAGTLIADDVSVGTRFATAGEFE